MGGTVWREDSIVNSVEMRGISKHYGPVRALDNVDFSLAKGEIHALLGENGAGKTTLMKILYAMEKPGGGSITLNGKAVHMKDSLDAIKEGIGMVHQHFMLVPILSVAENIVANQEPRKGLLFDHKAAIKQVEELSRGVGFSIDPRAKVAALSVGQCQRVEILKVLYRGADILIFDEPTAVLTPLEVDEFFATLRRLKAQGKSVVIITHKLHEVMDIADKITVLRDGKLIGSVAKSEASRESLAAMMVGRAVAMGQRRRAEKLGAVQCEIKNLSITSGGRHILKNIHLTIHKGEILGIAGIEGNGQTELIEAITGLRRANSMEIWLNGRRLGGGAKAFINGGMGHVPEDRGARGLAAGLSVEENLILGYEEKPPFYKKGLMQWGRVAQYAQGLIASYGIKTAGGAARAGSLSGGNQQKIVAARVFSQEPELVICAQPTRGVDIAAAEYIHSVMFDYRDRGKAVLLISADLDEVKKLSDTIAVMYKGEVCAIDESDSFSDQRLGLLMTGAARETAEVPL